jgi:hypothetical protein
VLCSYRFWIDPELDVLLAVLALGYSSVAVRLYPAAGSRQRELKGLWGGPFVAEEHLAHVQLHDVQLDDNQAQIADERFWHVRKVCYSAKTILVPSILALASLVEW